MQSCKIVKILHAKAFNAVKCNLTKLTTKSSWYLQSAAFIWYCRLSALCQCTSVFQRGSPCNILVVGLSSFLHIFGLFVDIFLCPLPPPSHPIPVSSTMQLFMWKYLSPALSFSSKTNPFSLWNFLCNLEVVQWTTRDWAFFSLFITALSCYQVYNKSHEHSELTKRL